LTRVFFQYLSMNQISFAFALNAEGIPPPRGRDWTASTLNGNIKRGAGLLMNELYAGRLVWNKVRMVKKIRTRRAGSRVPTPGRPG
jgi:site-specific DNA recombinase